MWKSQNRLHAVLLIVAIILGSLLSALFLFLGVANLMSTAFPETALTENAVVSAVLILTAAILIYALFRPSFGGLLLCICAVPCGFVFNAFHLSHVFYPSREVGYHPFWSAITCLVLLLGVLSVIRGRIRQRIATEHPVQVP
jgi:hypothetical protein